MSDPAAEFDGPWKEALDLYFRHFIELFFPDIGREIDWSIAPEFQDKELQQIMPAAVAGRGIVDKLATVKTLSGDPARVFVHVEVQSQHDADLPYRMYQYNHRLEDRYGPMPVSLAVLGDPSTTWRPNTFQAGRWGCEVRFQFPVAKVTAWRSREQELERSPNLFAAFVLAHLKTIDTDDSPADRLSWKLRVVKHLYARGMSQTDLFQLARLIDWMMTLPPLESQQFDIDIRAFEKEKQMPSITPREQGWLNEGRAEGLIRGIQLGLKLRFGEPGLELLPRVHQLKDPVAVDAFFQAIETASDLDTLSSMLPPVPQT